MNQSICLVLAFYENRNKTKSKFDSKFGKNVNHNKFNYFENSFDNVFDFMAHKNNFNLSIIIIKYQLCTILILDRNIIIYMLLCVDRLTIIVTFYFPLALL